MRLNPQCWPIREKIFVYLCRGIYERKPKKTKWRGPQLYNHNHHESSYSFFHVDNDTRAVFISVGKSRLHSLDWFQVDGRGKFVQNGTSVYDTNTSFECLYKKNNFLGRLLTECLQKENVSKNLITNPQMMILHFPDTKAPTYTVSLGDNTLYINWVIYILGLVLVLSCLK
ncbi:uncharacterized protein LOC108116385 [Drosophila eugracilis]|uniref:uncharacterized protein LOC108116385 n=1 Tax=Drosophila eugracilis TaxID=29029 RepID=UPI001BDA003B|nr:uncharacterized protein LOC108116385 [Drosophila eugracilis]